MAGVIYVSICLFILHHLIPSYLMLPYPVYLSIYLSVYLSVPALDTQAEAREGELLAFIDIHSHSRPCVPTVASEFLGFRV